MNRRVLLSLLVCFAVCICPESLSAQITLTGNFTPTYNGSNPWNVGTVLIVGRTANGTMAIDNGAVVNSNSGQLGRNPGVTGIATINGAGSQWNTSGQIRVGWDGIGQMDITGGGFVSGGVTEVGQNSSSIGVVNVDGGGSHWNPGGITAGWEGNGTVSITNGALVSTGGVTIADRRNSQGLITVSGTGSRLTSSSMWIGDQGNGTLTVNNGGVVTTNRIEIGSSSVGPGVGSATVDGAGSRIDNTGDLAVGQAGIGSLSVTNGAVVTSNRGYVARFAGSGNATVDGSGSMWAVNGFLEVGRGGAGTLDITNGAVVTAGDDVRVAGGFVGNNATINVDGIGSHFSSADWLTIGDRGNGNLNVLNGATVDSFIDAVGSITGSHGAATVNGTGSLWSTTFLSVGSNNGGTGTLDVQNGGVVNVADTLTIWNGGVVNLEGGELTVDEISVRSGGAIQMTGGELDARVITAGMITQNGGVLAPGDSPGLMTMNSSYEMNAGAIEFEIGGLLRGTEYDALNIAGFASLDGLMDVNLILGFAPSEGDSFNLISANGGLLGSPTFDFSDASLARGLGWDTSSFLQTGSISVIAVAIPEPTGVGLLAVLGCSMLGYRRRR